MGTFFQQISSILITSPGNLIYHIVLAFCLAASLQAALLTSRRGPESNSGRLVLGLSLVLVAQFIVFAASGLAWQQVADSYRYAPPLDRAVTAFSVIWIVWLWAFPRPARWADALAIFLSLIAIIAGIYTLNAWLQLPADVPFNGSSFDWYWEIASLVITGLGVLALLIARPPFWGIGLAALSLLLAGFTANLLMFSPGGDYSGVVRLGQLTAYLMLPVLAQRLLPAAPEAVEAPQAAVETPPARTGMDFRQAQSWSAVLVESDPEQRVIHLAKAVAQSVHADLCFFLKPPTGDGLWQIPGGYDLVTEEALTAAAVEPERIPSLTSAIQHGKAIRILPDDPGKAELVEVGRLFGLDDAGSLLAVPLIATARVWGGIVLLSPYQNREWEDETRTFVANLSESLAQILLATPAAPVQQSQVEDELKALRAENLTLTGQLNSLRQQKPAVDADALLVVQQEAQAVIASLQAENEQLKARLSAPVPVPAAGREEQEQMEGELRLLLQEVALLKNQLAQANMDLEKARHAPSGPAATPQGRDMVASIAQDLRQPVTIILGYAELLLADTAGALTADQRNLLLRVISSTERLRGMINDLLSAVMQIREMQILESGPVDLETVINEAVASNNGLLREKNIVLRVVLPEELPAVTGDRQALEQILGDLLRNAGAISPEGGEVLLRVDVEGADGARPAVVFQVTDSGGGIAPEDLPRVFQPRYRAGEPLAEGSADAGNSLPVVEALVKAQGGDVWVDSEAGKAARFTVRLPITIPSKPDSQAGV